MFRFWLLLHERWFDDGSCGGVCTAESLFPVGCNFCNFFRLNAIFQLAVWSNRHQQSITLVKKARKPSFVLFSMAQTKTNTYNVLPGTDDIWFLWSKQLYSGERKRCCSCAVTECKDRENSRQFCNFSFDTFPINVWQTKSMVDCWLGGYKLGLLSPLLPSPSLHLWNLINQGIHSEPTCVFYCVINPVLYCTVYS